MYIVMLARRQRISEPHASGAPFVGQSLWASACVGVIRPVIRETQSMLPKCRPVLAGNVARALLRSAQRVAGPVAASGMMCMGNSNKKLFQFQELRQEEAAVSFNPSCSACPQWLLLQKSGCTHVSNSLACWHAVMRGHCLKYQTHSEQDPPDGSAVAGARESARAPSACPASTMQPLTSAGGLGAPPAHPSTPSPSPPIPAAGAHASPSPAMLRLLQETHAPLLLVQEPWCE